MITHILNIIQPILMFGNDDHIQAPEMFLQIILQAHSIIRYLILIVLIAAIYYAFQGRKNGIAYAGNTKKTGLYTMILCDLQLVLGLILNGYYIYMNSKFKPGKIKHMLGENDFRFFTIEHGLMMIIAIVLIHLGYFKAKKAQSEITANNSQFKWFLAAPIIILIAIPWPFVPGYGRPWF